MPAFDGGGPQGLGHMTGRGFGPCGLGLGWRKKIWTQSKDEQLKALSQYLKALEEELEDVKKEMEELNKTD